MKEFTVRDARKRKGLTQEQLAAASGIDQSTISDLETGRHTNPRLDTITRLAKALGLAHVQLRFTAPESHGTVDQARDRSGQAGRPTRRGRAA